MKKITGFIILVAFACILACNKDTDEITNNATQADVENWFNTSFKESGEWQQNADSKNKLPDWSNGTYLKKDSIEVFEFPLIEDKATIAVPADKTITGDDTKKILEATLSRLVIIKTSTNKMLVRKLYYIPEHKYLLSKGYDISDVMLNKTNDDFTGLLITKKWDDEVLSYHKIKNGKIEEVLLKGDGNDSIGNSQSSIKMNNFATAKTGGLGEEQNLDGVVINYTYHTSITYVYLPSQPYYPSTSPTSAYDPYGTSSGGGSTGGGSTGGGSTSAAPTSPPPSCESFNFTSKSGTIWQEAAVKNVYLRVLLLNSNGVEIVHVISYPQPILFGTPTNIQVGNTNITAGLAANVSAKVLHDTMDEVIAKYGRTRTSDLIVDQYFRSQLIKNYPLSVPGGRVQFNSTSTLAATEYKTTFLFSSDCR